MKFIDGIFNKRLNSDSNQTSIIYKSRYICKPAIYLFERGTMNIKNRLGFPYFIGTIPCTSVFVINFLDTSQFDYRVFIQKLHSMLLSRDFVSCIACYRGDVCDGGEEGPCTSINLNSS